MFTPNNSTLVTGSSEVLIKDSNARLVKIIPQGATTGTVTVREASVLGTSATPRMVLGAAQAATPNGVDFQAYGINFAGGLTVQLSVSGDTFVIVWGPRL